MNSPTQKSTLDRVLELPKGEITNLKLQKFKDCFEPENIAFAIITVEQRGKKQSFQTQSEILEEAFNCGFIPLPKECLGSYDDTEPFPFTSMVEKICSTAFVFLSAIYLGLSLYGGCSDSKLAGVIKNHFTVAECEHLN